MKIIPIHIYCSYYLFESIWIFPNEMTHTHTQTLSLQHCWFAGQKHTVIIIIFLLFSFFILCRFPSNNFRQHTSNVTGKKQRVDTNFFSTKLWQRQNILGHFLHISCFYFFYFFVAICFADSVLWFWRFAHSHTPMCSGDL